MLENRGLISTAHLLMRSESRKAIENSVNLRASVAILIVVVLTACSSDEIPDRAELPDHISQLENVTVYDPETQPMDTVILTREAVFESGEEVFMSGNISNFTVDNEGRVFVVSSVPGSLGVYVFNPDGSYRTTIGSYGHGPGEFEAIGGIDVLDDKLILLDPRLQKFAIYSLDDLEMVEEEIVKLTEATRADQMPAIAKGTNVVLLENGDMVLQVGMSSLNEESDGKQIFYYSLKRDGTVIPERLLEVKRHARYFLSEREGWAIPITKPFNRSSLVLINRSGGFFTAWTEDFLIKEHDADGHYLRSIYYPVEKSEFSLDQIRVADHERRMLRGEEIPDKWPALHTLELDDEGRLWVATITDSETKFTWWVLNQKGELIARFQKEGERSNRFVPSKPLNTIKNGFFYSHERDLRQGIDRIVKYRMEFKEQV